MTKMLRIPLFVIIILIHVFLIFNAQLTFGPFAETSKTLLTVYLLVVAAIAGIFDVKPSVASTGVIGLQAFMIGFILTAVALIPISLILTQAVAGSITTLVAAASLGFMYAFVIAFDEELIFRDLLPKKLGVPDVIAQPLFGLFHATALFTVLTIKAQQHIIPQEMIWPFVLLGMITLTILGFVWAFVRDRIGIYGSTGSHFAYNLYTYGILFTLIGFGG